jgi:hypothetical protein
MIYRNQRTFVDGQTGDQMWWSLPLVAQAPRAQQPRVVYPSLEDFVTLHMYHKTIPHYESTHADSPKLRLTAVGSADNSAELSKVVYALVPTASVSQP